jgi:hypothetical protein
MIVKEWIIRLTLVAFGVIVGMVALEFGLSKFAPNPKAFHTGELNERDKYIGWKGKPNKEGYYIKRRIVQYVKINSHGFRDKERTYEKGKDVFRIVVLGDSFTEALQVPLEKTFPYILEKRLNLGVGKRFDVINLGIDGIGTAQEYLTLKYYGLKYHPDFVISQFFIGNDVVNNSLVLESWKGRPFFVLNAGKLEELPFKIKASNPSKAEGEAKREVPGQFHIKYLVLKYSTKFFPNIFYSLEDRIMGTPWLANFLWKIGIKKSKPELPDKDKDGFRISYYNYIYAEEYSPEFENAWEITKALIFKLAKELETDKIGFLIVVALD